RTESGSSGLCCASEVLEEHGEVAISLDRRLPPRRSNLGRHLGLQLNIGVRDPVFGSRTLRPSSTRCHRTHPGRLERSLHSIHGGEAGFGQLFSPAHHALRDTARETDSVAGGPTSLKGRFLVRSHSGFYTGAMTGTQGPDPREELRRRLDSGEITADE